MADKTLAERLQPSLLDRLTDDNPGDLQENRSARVIDMRRLKDILQRDLSWLLNTNNHESLLDEDQHKNVITSTVNYGIREVAGDYGSKEKAQQILQSVRNAIARFEPRIVPGSVEVDIEEKVEPNSAVVKFAIRADMWAQPIPTELYLKSSIDVTTGELTLERGF